MDVVLLFDSEVSHFFKEIFEPGTNHSDVQRSLRGMYFTKIGKKFWMSMNNSVISWKSKPAVLSTIRDITEKVLQEKAVREEAEDCILRKESLENLVLCVKNKIIKSVVGKGLGQVSYLSHSEQS